MVTQANIKSVLESDGDVLRDDGTATLSLELDAIPGAVWRTELRSLLPQDVRVSLFERGTQKCALLTFPVDQQQSAYATFEKALAGANEVSRQAHELAAAAREARRSAAG